MPRSPLSPAAVVDAAVLLADETGIDAVTLSAVARRLGVQAPSLYSHVRDLSALRDGIMESAFRELSARISQEIAGRSGAAALRGLADAHRALAQDSPGRWQSLQRRASSTVAQSDAARSVVTLLEAVLRGYAIGDQDRVHAIRLIGSTINGFITLESLGSFDHSTPEPEASWARVVESLDTLLLSWSGARNNETDSAP